MKHNKIIYILLGLFISFISILCLGYSSWIISSSEKITSVKIEQLSDPNLKDISLNIDYNGSAHLPHESISNFDSSNYKITYKDSNGGTIFDTNYLGYTDAGTYKVKYENITSHIVTEIDFKINKILPTISAEQTFYSPNANDYVLKALDINGNPINGTWVKTINGDPSDLTNTAGEGKDSHTISIAYTFTPNADCKNYKERNDVVAVGLKSVCYIDSKYYSRIENAANLSKNNTSNTSIYVIPLYATNQTKVYVYDSFEIGSKVSLILPYESTKYNGYEHLTYKDASGNDQYLAKPSARDNTAENLKTSEIVLNSDVTITNKGKLIIGGVLTGGNGGHAYAGHTYGKYAQITMGENTSIDNWGSIESYGYILEETIDSAYITNFSGSTFGLPFIVAEHRGGTNFMNLANLSLTDIFNPVPKFKSSAFNRYFTNNVDVIMKSEYGSKVQGFANLYAGNKDNTTNVSLIGSNSIIELTNSNGYIITNYDHSTEILDIDIFGGAKLNSMDLTITVYTVTVNLSTKTVLFPISYYYNIELKKLDGQNNGSCVYDLTQQNIKLLPGAKINIDEGVIVNAGTIAIYDKFDDVAVDAPVYPKIYKSGQTIPGGELNINGTLNVQNIGGNVKTTASNASLNISSSISVVSNEITGREYDTGYTATTYYLKGYLYQADNVSTNLLEMNVGKHKSFGYNNYYGWFANIGNGTITYNTLGGSTIQSTSLEDIGKGYNLADLVVECPSKLHYTFGGWYADEGLTVLVSEYINDEWKFINYYIYNSTTLYAKWNPIDYTLIYTILDENGSDVTDIYINNDQNNVNVNFDIFPYNLISFTRNGYKFDGWYTTENFTSSMNRIDKLDVSLDPNIIQNNTINLYAKWEAVSGILISFATGGRGNPINDIEVQIGDTITLPTTGAEGYTFTGWKYNGSNYAANSTFNVTSDVDIIFEAQWAINQYTITFNTNGGSDVPSVTKNYGETITQPTKPTRDGYEFAGWDINGDGKYTSSDVFPSTMPANSPTYTAIWNIITYTIDYQKGTGVDSIKEGRTWYTVEDNVTFDTNWITVNDNYEKPAWKLDGNTIDSTSGLTKNITVIAEATEKSSGGSCVTGDTLITLADGSKKRIDELTVQDILLAFNHFTGEYEATPLAALINHGEAVHDIMRLTFSDGTTLELIGRHGLFNVTLNEYSHFDTTTCFNFIDHEFIKYNNGVNKVVKLIDVTIYQKYVGSYTLITSQNLNSLANDMLNITTGMFGLYNIFEYDENHMFDKEQYELDVQKYGLYDYSVFEPYVEEQTFIDFGGKYFAVSIGKGYVDFETILGYIRWLDNMKQNGEASTN